MKLFWDVYNLLQCHGKNCKKYIFGSTGHNSLIQKVTYSLFKENILSLSFHDPPITPFKTFLQSKLCPEMTVRCLTSSLELRKKKISNTGKQCNHVLIPSDILSDSKKSLPSVERPKMCWNKQEQRTRNIGLNLADFAVGEEVVCILLLHSLTHSTRQHYGFASIRGSSHKNWS